MECESNVHRVYRIDRNHYFSSRLQASSSAEMSQFLQTVGSNGLPQHTQFPYAPAIFSRFGKHCSYVAFGKIHFTPNLLPAQNVVFGLCSRRSFYPSGHTLPLLYSASLSTLALVHVLSVALLRPVSSILLSFAGGASPSVDLLALRSHLLLKFFRRPLHAAALARRNSRDPPLSVMKKSRAPQDLHRHAVV